MESLINQGIREYLEALSSPQIQQKLLPFITGLEDVGNKKVADRMRALINFTLSDLNLEESLDTLSQLLDPSLIDAMNEAMSGKAVVVERDLDELYENLIERNFTRRKLEEIFREWVEGKEKIDQETYVKVTTGKAGNSVFGGREGKLKEVIEQRFPELSILAQTMSEKDFTMLLWSTGWLTLHTLAFEKIEALFNFPTSSVKEEWERVAGSLVEMSSYLVEHEKHLADELIQHAEGEIIASEKRDAFLHLLSEGYGEKGYLLMLEHEGTFSFSLKWILEKLVRVVATKPKMVKVKDLDLVMEKEKAVHLPPSLKKKEVQWCLRDYIELSNVLEYLKNFDTEKLKTYSDWEKLYLKQLAPLPYLYSASFERMKHFQCLDEILMREKKKVMSELTIRLEEEFSAFYHASYPLWLKGKEKRPFFIRDVTRAVYDNYMKRFKGHPASFILLDGMRWDLWCYLKERFIPALKGSYRILEEIPLWSHLPSTTEIQLEDLLKGNYIPREKESLTQVAEEKAAYGEKGEIRLEDRRKIEIDRFIDGKIHTSRDSLFIIFQEVLQYMHSSFAPRIEVLPKRSMIFLFSDHGFKDNPRFNLSDKYSESRYTHGGNSFWEIIVPLVVLLKL
jgi:hypothetical protein